MKKSISVIIPTLQKDIKTLNTLVSTLVSDDSVKEIIIIDNSLKGYHFDNDKVRVIIPKENLYVNPSWNLGVKEGKNEYVCIANDDIKIANNFCSNVVEKITDEYGVIGMNRNFAIDTRDEYGNILIDINATELENSKEINLVPIKIRPHNFGIIMFFKRENYVEIPEDIKIFYGDDWLIYQLQKRKKINAVCEGQKVYHLGALSSKQFVSTLFKKDGRNYYRRVLKLKYLLGYSEDELFKYFFIFGIKIKKRKR